MGGIPFHLQTRECNVGVRRLRLKSDERDQYGGDPRHEFAFGDAQSTTPSGCWSGPALILQGVSRPPAAQELI
jgi:hypothetical protein